MGSDRVGNRLMGCRGQHKLASIGLLLSKKAQKIFTIWQISRRKSGRTSDLCLEMGYSSQQPEGQQEEAQRSVFDKLKDAFDKRVRRR